MLWKLTSAILKKPAQLRLESKVLFSNLKCAVVYLKSDSYLLFPEYQEFLTAFFWAATAVRQLQYLDISLGPLAVFWSKTTLNTGCVSGTWVDPTSCKMGSFFLRSLALSVPIYRNFQSNGAKWRSLKLWVLH